MAVTACASVDRLWGAVVGLTGRDGAPWAIVTTGASCGVHQGPCPSGVWGPYASLSGAHEAAKFVTAGHNPHVVPYWVRGNDSPGTQSGESAS